MIVPDFSMTTLAAAMANTEAAVKIQVDQMNSQLRAAYRTSFDSYAINVNAGRESGPPPPVPFGYGIGHFPDSTNSAALWAFPELSDQPVMPALPPPPIPKPYVPPSLPEPENIRNVPLGDTMPVGFILTAGDGAKWQKQSSHTPFGIAYFYARIG